MEMFFDLHQYPSFNEVHCDIYPRELKGATFSAPNHESFFQQPLSVCAKLAKLSHNPQTIWLRILHARGDNFFIRFLIPLGKFAEYLFVKQSTGHFSYSWCHQVGWWIYNERNAWDCTNSRIRFTGKDGCCLVQNVLPDKKKCFGLCTGSGGGLLSVPGKDMDSLIPFILCYSE